MEFESAHSSTTAKLPILKLEDDESKGDGGEGLYVRGRSGQRDMEQSKGSAWSKSQGRRADRGIRRDAQGIDKEDLQTLWKLVKTKHGDIRPED
ncbi:hypothetical protein Tco_0291171 [Tanacetum coccineum]